MRRLDLDDLGFYGIGILLCALFAVVIFAIVAEVADTALFQRRAFTAIASCRAHRMEYQRKYLSTETVCIPAYRETKNDTVTVNGLSRVAP